MTTPQPAYIAELRRHFADLRDGTHGDATSRRDKEQLFTEAVSLLDPYARQAAGSAVYVRCAANVAAARPITSDRVISGGRSNPHPTPAGGDVAASRATAHATRFSAK